MATPKASTAHLETVVIELAALEEIAQELMEDTARSMDEAGKTAFMAQCNAYIKEGKLEDLVQTFVDNMSQACASSTEQQVKSRFSILFSLARHLLPQALEALVPRVVDVVLGVPACGGSPPAAAARMRLDVLANLYTIVDPVSKTRYGTLMRMLEYSLANDTFVVFDGTNAADVEELCLTWTGGDAEGDAPGSSEAAASGSGSASASASGATSVTPAMKLALYQLLCDVAARKLAASPPDAAALRAAELKENQFLIRYLQTLDEMSAEGAAGSAPAAADVSKYAARAAVIAVKYPLPGDTAAAAASGADDASPAGEMNSAELTAGCSVLALFSAVQALAQSPQHAALHELVMVFAAQGLDEFKAFQATHPAALGDLGLDAARCLEHIRLLTLASLAAQHAEVTYATIAEKLQIEEGEVETWVINGIISKLIDAKMDQRHKNIVINRGSQRLLTDQQWVDVQRKLHAWQGNVRQILLTVQSVREEQEMIAQQKLQG